jgi:ABC-type cobalamin/Fe3+-siderophores transport system ATPase subunit
MMVSAATSVFSIRDGWFGYTQTPVLEDINLSISRGKFYGLIGPNGSGKSTLLDLFTATKQPDQGEIVFKDRPVATYRRQELARLIALVPQDFTLGFDYTVFDVVLMGRHPHIPRFSSPSGKDLDLVENALTIMDIAGLRNRTVTDLSGGEKQRVVVARALAQDTEVLILDEATSSLDIRHTIEIMRVIYSRVAKMSVTVIAAIHDLNLAAAFCDELIVLKDGKIVTSGPVQEILTDTLIRQVFSVESHVYLHSETQTPRVEYELHKNDMP